MIEKLFIKIVFFFQKTKSETGETPYICMYCNKTFLSLSSLILHNTKPCSSHCTEHSLSLIPKTDPDTCQAFSPSPDVMKNKESHHYRKGLQTENILMKDPVVILVRITNCCIPQIKLMDILLK